MTAKAKKEAAPPKEAPKEVPAGLTLKKFAVLCGLFLGFIVLPVFLASTSMMECYQRRIDRNPASEFNKWLQMASADVCFRTMRPELAADYYRRFRDTYKNDLRRPKACLRYAMALEESDRSADAIAEYQRYADEYPDREDTKEAVAGIDRIRYVRTQ